MRKYLDSNVIYSTKDMTKKEWLLKRKEGIGGSDVASILGISPYKSSVSVYLDKTSDELETYTLDNYKMELGGKLEDFVAKEFTLRTNKKVRNVNGILKNEKYPYSIANIDKAVVGERAFLECVVTNSFNKKKYKNEVPSHIKAQCYHYMAITGATHCYVAILVGNEELIIHTLNRDEDAINEIMKIDDFTSKLHLLMKRQFAYENQKLNLLSNQLVSKIDLMQKSQNQHLEYQRNKLMTLMSYQLKNKKQLLLSNVAQLNAYNPLNVLERGYTLAMQDEQIVTRKVDLDYSKPLIVNFNDGKVLTYIQGDQAHEKNDL